MKSQKPHIMRQMIFKNKRYFGGALVFTLGAVIIDFITPVLLAETLDVYIGAGGEEAKSHLPGFINSFIEGLGGKENVTSIDHCVTRLRLEVKDRLLVDEKKIKTSGAAGVIRPGKTSVQVVIGPKVQFVYDEFKKLAE